MEKMRHREPGKRSEPSGPGQPRTVLPFIKSGVRIGGCKCLLSLIFIRCKVYFLLPGRKYPGQGQSRRMSWHWGLTGKAGRRTGSSSVATGGRAIRPDHGPDARAEAEGHGRDGSWSSCEHVTFGKPAEIQVQPNMQSRM